MASKITTAIGAASWELIGAKIKTILEVELPSQATLAGDSTLDVVVWRERLVPFGEAELPAINVSLARTGLDNQDQLSVRGSNTFYIDIYTKAKSDSSTGGQDLSAFYLQKLAGVVRGILEHPVYKLLDFDAPFINKRNFSTFIVGKPSSQEDGLNVAMGRFEFDVVATDENGVNPPFEIVLSNVTMKLDETELGYIFEYINTE